MKILTVSGFLGAGKTTFIKEMIRQTGKDLVIMENEYGDVGIDRDLLKDSSQLPERENLSGTVSDCSKTDRASVNSSPKIDIRELTEGCICCSTKSDFASSVLTIANTLDPEFLIVEPTGVGYLSNVINNINMISYERIRLLRPVTIVDAYSFDRYMYEYKDIFADQLRASGMIIFSKGDFSSERENNRLISEIRRFNNDAPVLMEHYTKMGKEFWEDILSTDLKGGKIISSPAPSPALDSFGLNGIRLKSPSELVLILEHLIRGGYGNICRSKGFVYAGSELIRFDVASENYSITGCDGSEESKAVFIGRDINKNELRKLLLPDYKRQIKIRG